MGWEGRGRSQGECHINSSTWTEMLSCADKQVLRAWPSQVKPGGVVALVSPYSWLAAWTPKDKWQGGFMDKVGLAWAAELGCAGFQREPVWLVLHLMARRWPAAVHKTVWGTACMAHCLLMPCTTSLTQLLFHPPPPKQAGKPVRSAEVVGARMRANGFELVHEENVPFLIREHVRKFQWGCSHAGIWRLKKAA